MNVQTPSFEQMYTSVAETLKRVDLTSASTGQADQLAALIDAHPRLQSKSELQYLRANSMAAELFDYHGQRDKALDRVALGGHVYAGLRQTMSPLAPIETRQLDRERIRFVAHYAAQAFYRKQKYPQALEILLRCKDLIKSLADPDTLPCWGTLGQIHYYLGRTYRQLNALDEAEAEFSYSIHCYWKQAEHTITRSKTVPSEATVGDVQQALRYSSHKAGKCMANGLAWVNITRGFYKSAQRQNLWPARVLLAFTEDPLNKARVDLLEGTVMRALAGFDKPALKAAIAILNSSASVCEEHGHSFYAAKAAYELGLAHIYLHEFEEAAGQMDAVRLVAEQTDDNSWKCWAMILEVRLNIAMDDFEEGKEKANSAVALADHADRSMQICLIESLLVRARVWMGLGLFDNARADLNRALSVNGARNTGGSGSPKTEAACYLRLALISAQTGDVTKATLAFDSWIKLKPIVEHQALHVFASEVAAAIATLQEGFVIAPNTDDLNYKKHDQRLRSFLMDAADRKVRAKYNRSTQELIAEELKISRVTLSQWIKSVKAE